MSSVKGLRERLRDGEDIICAEGYMWELERRGFVCCGDFTPEVVLQYPEKVKALHEEFVWAGSDVVEAYTYYAHREKLRAIGHENDIESINLKALDIAKEVATNTNTLMAGNICNTTIYHPSNAETIEQAEAMFKEQIEWAVNAGADFIIAETFMDYGEAKLALECIQKYGAGLPAVVTMAAQLADETFDQIPFPQAMAQLEQLGADVVGLNCSRGPDTMMLLLKEILKVCKGPVAALPVPIRTSEKTKTLYSARDPKDGRPIFPADIGCIQSSRSEIREFAEKAKALGIRYIGLCCGSSVALMRELAQAYGRSPLLSKFAPNLSRNFYMKKDLSEAGKRSRELMLGKQY